MINNCPRRLIIIIQQAGPPFNLLIFAVSSFCEDIAKISEDQSNHACQQGEQAESEKARVGGRWNSEDQFGISRSLARCEASRGALRNKNVLRKCGRVQAVSLLVECESEFIIITSVLLDLSIEVRRHFLAGECRCSF